MRSLEKGLGLTWITTALVIAAVPSAWAEVNKFGELARLDGLAAPFALVLLGLMSISSFRGLRSGVVVGLHMAAIVGITLIVGRAQPDLWVHPFGFLVLNLNAAAATWAAWRIRIGAGGRRTSQVLLWALSILWFTQGLLPKILYQHPLDLELVGAVLGDLMDPGRFLWLLGAFEMAIAVLTLALRGTRLRALLLIQAILLAGFAVPSAILQPDLLLSPFAPIQKTLLVAVTAVVARSLAPRT